MDNMQILAKVLKLAFPKGTVTISATASELITGEHFWWLLKISQINFSETFKSWNDLEVAASWALSMKDIHNEGDLESRAPWNTGIYKSSIN